MDFYLANQCRSFSSVLVFTVHACFICLNLLLVVGVLVVILAVVLLV